MTITEGSVATTTLLTPDQQLIVEADVSARLLITAGPGTGKTYTLIARLNHLIESYGISPGHELLVLSFSRTAVYEVRRRVAAAGGDVRYVRACTFDSFATQLLMEFEPNTDLSQLDYEDRILRATGLLRVSRDTCERIGIYKHIMVDEVQDLVGVRSDFVATLLHVVQCGFTVLGDPAQGIYTFQLDGGERLIGAAAFYRELRRRFKDTLMEYTLAENHRAKFSSAKVALWAGYELNQPQPDYDDIKYRLYTDVMGLRTLGRLCDSAQMLRSSEMTTAILCRTNGQALAISQLLWEAEVPHHLQRHATERVLPSWIALSLAGLDQQRASKKTIVQRLEKMILPPELTPGTAWMMLKRMDATSGDTLDLGRVAERIRMGMIPDELIDRGKSNLVVSTVHRAKGLEFDRVIITEPKNTDNEEPADVAEEARVLYVALTRPKKELRHVLLPNMQGIFKHEGVSRWVRRYRSWEYKEIEVRGADTHWMDPVGGFLVDEVNPVETQDYLNSSICVGDPVVLTKRETKEMGALRIHYVVSHQDHIVGITSEQFGRDLYQVLKINPTWKINWPVQIQGLFVEGIDTVAGSSAAGRRSGLGYSGIWLRIRVGGLGRLLFEKFQR